MSFTLLLLAKDDAGSPLAISVAIFNAWQCLLLLARMACVLTHKFWYEVGATGQGPACPRFCTEI